jgi:hypothetical protein
MPLAKAGAEAQLQRLKPSLLKFDRKLDRSACIQLAGRIYGRCWGAYARRLWELREMKMKFLASVAALAGAGALLAGPSLAAPHFSGGGGHFGGGAHFSGARAGGAHFNGAFRSGGAWGGHGWRGGGWRGGGWRGGGWGWGPGWGWYDPFFWGGVGFVAGYDLAPYWDDYYDYPDDGYGPPPGAAPAAPAGYNCDGWRWDASQQRYVAAKVACN